MTTEAKGHRILPSDSLALKTSFLCYDSTKALTKGQIVYITGRQGKNYTVAKASASTAGQTSGMLLVAEHNTGGRGYVRCKPVGAIELQNTNGLTVGDKVYLSATAGGWSTSGAGKRRRVGTVAVVSATVGVIAFNGFSDGGDRIVSGTGTVLSGQTALTITAATLGGSYGGSPVVATINENATNSVYVRSAAWSTDDLVVTLSGDPGASNADFTYMIKVS